MKKILVAVSALVLGTTAMAQTDQGVWMFGAGSNLGFTSGKVDNDQEDATSNLDLDVRWLWAIALALVWMALT